MSNLINIYEDVFCQPGRVISVEKKRVITEKGVLISFYEAQVEYPNGDKKYIIHIY
ncbi:Uncharacterised protein [Yersinia intermedia]|nr:Uncharacterised protein [Yersinia intermedia]